MPKVSAKISGNVRVPVLQLICYTSDTLKICLNLLLTALTIYKTMDSFFDYGILILAFLVMFICTIDPTSFDYGLSLNIGEEMFHQKVLLKNRGIMVSSINVVIIMHFCIVQPY